MSNRLDRHIESRMALRKKQLVKKILESKTTSKRKLKLRKEHKVTNTMNLIKEIQSIESGEARWNWQYREQILNYYNG